MCGEFWYAIKDFILIKHKIFRKAAEVINILNIEFEIRFIYSWFLGWYLLVDLWLVDCFSGAIRVCKRFEFSMRSWLRWWCPILCHDDSRPSTSTSLSLCWRLCCCCCSKNVSGLYCQSIGSRPFGINLSRWSIWLRKMEQKNKRNHRLSLIFLNL